MKIYIVWGWNGWNYEDSYEWIEAIYKTKENAEKRCEELNKKAKQDYKKGHTFEEARYRIIEKELLD